MKVRRAGRVGCVGNRRRKREKGKARLPPVAVAADDGGALAERESTHSDGKLFRVGRAVHGARGSRMVRVRPESLASVKCRLSARRKCICLYRVRVCVLFQVSVTCSPRNLLAKAKNNYLYTITPPKSGSSPRPSVSSFSRTPRSLPPSFANKKSTPPPSSRHPTPPGVRGRARRAGRRCRTAVCRFAGLQVDDVHFLGLI
jgi:hypothetical protein